MRKLMIVAVGLLSFAVPTAVADEVPCQEDQACWNCETMGNKICGLTPSENAAELAESTTHNGTELPKTE